MKIDVTHECSVKLEQSTKFSKSLIPGDHVLVYLYHKDIRIGIFDRHGFHYMKPPSEYAQVYSVEDTHGSVSSGIYWFSVFKK